MRTIEDIEQERKRQRITKRMLLERSGVHAETYRRILLGRSSPVLRTLERLDSALCELRIGAAE